jgi:hypothetical protein
MATISNRTVVRCVLWIMIGIGMMSAPCALATVVFTVNSNLDQVDDDPSDGVCHTVDNTCTLRAAVMQANRMPNAGATIVLPAGTYTLTRPPAGTDDEYSGDLNLTTPSGYTPGPTTIIGAGADVTIIDANGIDRVLYVDFGRTVVLSGLTLRNGVTASDGGGIYNDGALTVDLCRIESNTADSGGGIHGYSGGTLLLKRSTLHGNHAAFGGGLSQTKGNVEIVQSTISGNSASYDGGGISATYPHFITNSTIVFNNAHRDGGGISFSQGTANVYNSTIAFNQAAGDDTTGGTGGGIHNANFGTFNIRNTIVAGNNLSNAPIYDDCNGEIGIYGNNRYWQISGCTAAAGSTGSWSAVASLDELGQLQNFGGPTETMALLAPSTMIDGATSGCVDKNGVALPTDQRGYPRIAGVRCDIGAFEYGIIFANGFQ